jgi:hypothetical protein
MPKKTRFDVKFILDVLTSKEPAERLHQLLDEEVGRELQKPADTPTQEKPMLRLVRHRRARG